MTRINLWIAIVFLLMSAACAKQESQFASEASPDFVTDVPLLEERMLSADFWIRRLARDDVRLTGEEIAAMNAASFERDPNLYDLDQFPDIMPREQVLALIDGVSRPAASPRFFTDGRPVTEETYARLEAAVQRSALPEQVPLRWGLAVRRASMRSYPTTERVLKNPDDRGLDRFQETGVFPGHRLALLHESADGKWWFAVNYHYAAWLPKSAVAEGSREQITAWEQRAPRLTVTGAQVRTNFNPEEPRTSEILLDMGVSLPLLSAREVGHNVHGQNPHASYIVSLPVREEDGSLAFEPTLIARSRDVTVGHLDYRPSLVLRQAFKFLGERYGWGHDYNGRDCTGFVGEVYQTFGILMPRNSGDQGKSDFAPTRRFAEGDDSERREALEDLSVGDLIYIPGHVMMYIGRVNGEPYVIHDVTGLSYYSSDESLYKGTLSGVSVTPLMPLRLASGKRYVDSIYAIKSIF
ncbi:NlpC/P60 family protein [Microbulbifer thermotolerans]|uniref:NlpC/P60 family protein n=1 Tax=Microbulbifer thermotolerans TaxID=252514 RepID=UPI0022499F0D|nr:NlpC/P60 family protein [Microbulbifer thermotolerans]MCX2794806.1 NlpC/P60 family protein [Microbulbifer thermotolerans]